MNYCLSAETEVNRIDEVIYTPPEKRRGIYVSGLLSIIISEYGIMILHSQARYKVDNTYHTIHSRHPYQGWH